MLSFSDCLVCVCLQLSIIFEKHGIMELCKVNLDIGKLLIQCNRNCCCENITGGVNIYLYGCVSVLTPVCV